MLGGGGTIVHGSKQADKNPKIPKRGGKLYNRSSRTFLPREHFPPTKPPFPEILGSRSLSHALQPQASAAQSPPPCAHSTRPLPLQRAPRDARPLQRPVQATTHAPERRLEILGSNEVGRSSVYQGGAYPYRLGTPSHTHTGKRGGGWKIVNTMTINCLSCLLPELFPTRAAGHAAGAAGQEPSLSSDFHFPRRPPCFVRAQVGRGGDAETWLEG